MELKEEFLHIVQEVWAKLQGLPQASPLELGAFFIIVLFIGALLSMILICCIHCCCCGKPKHQTSRVQPLHPV